MVDNNKNRRWILASRPVGDDFESALQMVPDAPVPSPKEGQVLVKPLYISMDAGTRMWMTDREDSYQPPLPIGSAMPGMMIAEVVESRRPDFAVGDTLRCFGEWADYSVVDESAGLFNRFEADPEVPLPAYLALGGPSGWTALAGMRDVAEVKEGDVVVVSAAAGATGSLAGQIAKNLGGTVIGLTSRDDKCRWLVDDLGFDAAINYRTQDLSAELSRLAPEGVNAFFDNVGGDILDTVMGNMALYSRIAVCGMVANYGASEKPPGPRNFDQILAKRITVKGFFSPDWFDQTQSMEEQLMGWYKAGTLRYNLELIDGLDNILSAYHRLFDGSNTGKVMVKI